MEIAICVITYQRPRGLARLLHGLNELTLEGEPPDIRCIVVDNEEGDTARTVCDEIRPHFRWKLESYIEPRRGIPFARNTAVARAGQRPEFTAFIDDDEVPEPRWLAELLRIIGTHKADVATGPVVPCFQEEPPGWVIKGRFFDRPRRETGCPMERAFTGNVLLRTEVFKNMDRLFDERLALAGGSDAHFFTRVHRAGYKIVWADQAVVREWQPTSRLNAAWILRRSFRLGSTFTFIKRDLHSTSRAVFLVIPIGVYRICKGLFFLPLTCLLGRHFIVTYLRHICYGAGMLSGLFGTPYEEYRRTHGF